MSVNRILLSLEVDEAMHSTLKSMAATKRISLRALVCDALRDFIAGSGGQPPLLSRRDFDKLSDERRGIFCRLGGKIKD